MKTFLFIFTFFASIFGNTSLLFSQVTIGSSYKPNVGSLLDLKEYNDAEAIGGGRTATKGLLIPRVQLININSLEDIEDADLSNPSAYDGLIIYNILRTDLIRYCSRTIIPTGIYLWTNQQWTNFDGQEFDSGTKSADIMATGQDANGINWALSKNGTLTLCGNGPMQDFSTAANQPWASYRTSIKKLVIKDGITSIGDNAFNGTGNATGTLNIPSSVTTIGVSAFANCGGLTGHLEIPSSVTTIKEMAFLRCVGITSITIPSSITTIETATFSYNFGLTSITIPSSVKTLKSQCFTGCKSLESITLPTSITQWEDGILSDCTSLKNLNIPNSVTEIPIRLLVGCTKLTNISIPDGITIIKANAFNDCTNLSSVTMPNSVITIEDEAFSVCPALSSVKLSENLQYIGKSAFEDCSVLNNLTIPASVTNIDYEAFLNCPALTTLYSYCPASSYKGQSEPGSIFSLTSKPPGWTYIARTVHVTDAAAKTSYEKSFKNWSFTVVTP